MFKYICEGCGEIREGDPARKKQEIFYYTQYELWYCEKCS